MNEKICPLMKMVCNKQCAWLLNAGDEEYEVCAIASIGDTSHSLMMSFSGCHPDEPISQITEHLERMSDALSELKTIIETTEFTN